MVVQDISSIEINGHCNVIDLSSKLPSRLDELS